MLFRGQTSVVWFDLKSQAVRTLVSGKEMLTDEKISPDGRWVSFVRDYNVWIVSTGGGDGAGGDYGRKRSPAKRPARLGVSGGARDSLRDIGGHRIRPRSRI